MDQNYFELLENVTRDPELLNILLFTFLHTVFLSIQYNLYPKLQQQESSLAT